ncbi:unnamed protein product [marine sediment metagenome]|uniref:Uncharacterized protein n=1 Tax=marine sediment metagenome TaxID=412755 RepID=X0YQD7_9ZZZZ
MKFDDVLDGGMLGFPHKAIMIACCTCGLSHMFVFMTSEGEPCLKVYGDDDMTKSVREDMTLKEIDAVIKEFKALRRRKRGKITKTKPTKTNT